MTILGSLEADLMTLFKFNMLITEISARSSCWTCCFEYSCPSGHARIMYSCSDYVFMLGLRIHARITYCYGLSERTGLRITDCLCMGFHL